MCIYTLVICVCLRYNKDNGEEGKHGKAPSIKERGLFMPVKYKIDILSALKGKGYSTYKLRKDKLLAEATIQTIRSGGLVSWENISRICSMLQCQPGDILEYVEDSPE